VEIIKSKSANYLVFTSVGRNSNVQQWMTCPNFDLFVVDYCDGNSQTKQLANYYLEHKGGKFQNLHYCYHQWKDIFTSYDAIMVMDDDIVIPSDKINQLFDILIEHDLSILQPAFSARGKVSHEITQVKCFSSIRKTNFVEVTLPLFKTSELTSFLDLFDPVANGGGVDWWFCHHAESRRDKPCIAIIDSIVCLNPHDVHKGGTREIDLFRSREQRNADWALVKKRNHLTFPENNFYTYDVLKKNNVSHCFFWLTDRGLAFIGRVHRKLLRTLKSA
jgi:hypothetical protein